MALPLHFFPSSPRYGFLRGSSSHTLARRALAWYGSGMNKPALGLSIARELTGADIARIADTRASVPVVRGSLARLTQKHHLLARYLAKGYTPEQASMLSGHSPGYARTLKGDPTFEDLLAYYVGESEEFQELARMKLEGISMAAMDEIMDRLEDDAQRAKVPMAQLESLVKTTADRMGLGPQTKQETNVTVGIAQRLEAARQRMKVVEHE